MPLNNKQKEFISEEMLSEFEYHPLTRVVYGPGTSSRIGTLADELSCNHYLLVTDHGLRDAGHLKQVCASLEKSEVRYTIFDDVHPNPTTEDVARGLKIAQENQIDGIIGLGGGSSMDCAKGINFLFSNGGKMQDYWGVGKAQHPMLPMIAIPTTAGTGSEAQSFALISDFKTHQKMACGDKKAACKIAILDPELTLSMPASVTAVTGIDAISHAIETHVTNSRTMLSQMFSRQAWRLLAPGLSTVLESPDNLEARGAVLLGANYAGCAIENSMLGATHALANPLTSQYKITHGIAIGIMLPHVIRFNSRVVSELYGELANDLQLCSVDSPEAGAVLADYVTDLVQKSGLPGNLRELDVDPHRFGDLAEEAKSQWTGQFNPHPVDIHSLKELYACAYEPFVG
jgi:alcohol dehydrogenase class IV